jgi:hypothetical protein
MNKEAYDAGVKQALFDAGISMDNNEKQAADLGVTQALFDAGITKEAGKADAAAKLLEAAAGGGGGAAAAEGGGVMQALRKLLSSGKELGSDALSGARGMAGKGRDFAMSSPVAAGAGGGALLGGGGTALGGGDLSDILMGAGIGGGLGAGAGLGAKSMAAGRLGKGFASLGGGGGAPTVEEILLAGIRAK